MRNFIALFSMALAICSCSGDGKLTVEHIGMDIDSVVVDSIYNLQETDGPKCEVSLQILFFKGGKSQAINDTLLRSGLLTPDYLALSGERIDVRQAVDSFVRRYINDYKTDFGALYREDHEHGASYNCAYSVKTRARSGAENVLVYVASIYTYAGGAHGINQTLVKNFDTRTGKLIRLSDIFVPGYEQSLKEQIVEKLAERFKTNGLEGLNKQDVFTDQHIYIPENFILNNDDITFIYCEDEIAPHAVGEIRVKIDKDDISKLLRKNV